MKMLPVAAQFRNLWSLFILFVVLPSPLMAQDVEAPAFDPDGGSFVDQVQVTLSTATDPSTIHYTLDGTDPDATSTVYAMPIDLTETTTLRAVTINDMDELSAISEATFTKEPPVTNDGGLTGRYFGNERLQGLEHTRRDAVVNFQWEDGEAPAPDVEAGRFSVIWSGFVVPRYSDNYTLTTYTDDGVRLWLDGKLIIDDWNSQSVDDNSGSAQLVANREYEVWFEYFNRSGAAVAELHWESADQSPEVIPSSGLIPDSLNDRQSTISLTGTANSIVVPETTTDTIQIRLRRRRDLDEAVEVVLEVTGDATETHDFIFETKRIIFEAGQTSASTELTVVDDETVEETESFVVRIADGPYQIEGLAETTIQIEDNDRPGFVITGEVAYMGILSGMIRVETFNEEMAAFQVRSTSMIEPGPFRFDGLDEGNYQVVAYIDTNNNERLDSDELWARHPELSDGDLVAVPPNVEGIQITLIDVVAPETICPDGGDGEECESTVSCHQTHARRAAPIWAFFFVSVCLGVWMRRKVSAC